MPLETANYISDLNASNPAASDPLSYADDHMRLIKGALKATFPAITGAVSASHTDLNNVSAFFAGTKSVNVPLGSAAAPSYAFVGDLDTGWYSPGANQAALSLGGSVAVSYAADKSASFAGNVSCTGTLTATGAITGPGVVPIGGMLMWLSDTLPTTGSWCWANGGTLSRTGNGAALYSIIGTTYGAGDGSTTFNVINMQEVVPVGKSTMGGASSPGLLSSMAAGIKGVLNGLMGLDTTTLTAANLPPHQHGVYIKDPGHTHTTNAITGTSSTGGGGFSCGGNGAATINSASTGITIGSVSGTANDNKTDNGLSLGLNGNAINNIQPSRAVNFIIRIG